MTTHVCLLDTNPIPAITPLVDKEFPSEKVIFAFTPEYQKVSERLTKQMLGRGLKVGHWPLPDSVKAEDQKMSFMNLLDKYKGEELWLNASCGQRHVNLAAYEVFRLHEKSIFCVEPKTDVINWIYPDGKLGKEVSDTIRIIHYLEAYGAQQTGGMKSPGVPKDIYKVCADWAHNGKSYKFAIRALNYIAKSAENERLLSEKLSHEQYTDHALNKLIDDLEALEYCKRVGERIEFSNEDARFFANGGWLENYVFATVRRLRGKYTQIQDDGISIDVERKSGNSIVKNELDVGILADNKLHFIECKTKKFSSGEGNNVIYKIDSLVELLGGLEAKGMIVSYLPMSKYEKARARDLGVEIVDYNGINQLSQRLESWLFA